MHTIAGALSVCPEAPSSDKVFRHSSNPCWSAKYNGRKFMTYKIQVVQNKMIRYVLNYSNRTHLIAKDFNEVKWMSIENRIK